MFRSLGCVMFCPPTVSGTSSSLDFPNFFTQGMKTQALLPLVLAPTLAVPTSRGPGLPQAACRTMPDDLTNVLWNPTACKQQLPPPSLAFSGVSGGMCVNFSRDAPGRRVLLGLDVLLDALLDVRLVAIGVASSAPHA